MRPCFLLIALVWTLGIAVFPGLALGSVPPGDQPPPSPPPIAPAERFKQAGHVVYGTIVRLDQDARTGLYRATLQVKRSWKGASENETVEIGGSIFGSGDCVPVPRSPFSFFNQYLVFLVKEPGQDSCRADKVIRVSTSHEHILINPVSDDAFGNSFQFDRNELPELEIMEFLERKSGNVEAADRLLADLDREHRREAEEAEKRRVEDEQRSRDEAAREKVKQGLQKALEESDPVRRQVLLESLLEQLTEQDPAADELRRKIYGELSVVETAQRNRLKQVP